jgi:hypothetical protein
MMIIVCFTIYLVLSIAVTVWVGRTLYRNGRVFLVDAMRGNEALADSINHLLIVGFYLINIGYATLVLKDGVKPQTAVTAFEFVSSKVGLVLLILGGMHFFNMIVLGKVRGWARSLREERVLDEKVRNAPGATP